ncbi:aldolase [Cohnella pontilimi]|uniref:Aldolase n=1 Tax=Cohnella pontilimi TaxID=2564100 RepID=A0A4U0F974_9BACL|nr:HRDC domain-containing protein [Cohnella pontilimi]TJY41028.1 aldolase [Cohnella pontilimi]
MQIVFLNRLDRVDARGEARGQVFIGEHQGTWTAGWRNHEAEAAGEDEIWYEGISWEELLAAFRHGAAGKMREGFRPLIDGMLDEPAWERKPQHAVILQCYADLQEADPELLNRLRLWRRAKASEEGRSAYLVATNRELQMLAVYRPATAAELGHIPGFAKMKTEKYGKDLSEIFHEVPRDHAFPLDWVAQAVDPERFTEWTFRQKQEKYGKTLASVRDKRALLSAIRDGQSLAEMESLLQCTRRQLVERIERLDDEGYDVLPIIDRELTTVSNEEWTQASEAMAQLGDRYLKPLLHKLYGETAAGDKEVERHYEKLRMMRIRFRRERQTAI